MPLIEPVARCRKFNALKRDAQWFYLQLKTVLDPAGRYDAHPGILNSTLFPLRNDVRDTDISRWLRDCETAGLSRCYADGRGRAVVEVFDARQSRMKSIRSEYDDPGGQQPLFSESGTRSAECGVRNGSEKKGREEKGRESREATVPMAEKLNGHDAMIEVSPLNRIRQAIGDLYKRRPDDVWTYAEESMLAEVCRRPAAAAEFAHILAYRKSMPVEDRKRFFPQSVNSLLGKWSETLDKARVACPPAKAPIAKIQAPARKAEPVSEGMLRESIEFLESEQPKSALLPQMRRQLEELMKFKRGLETYGQDARATIK